MNLSLPPDFAPLMGFIAVAWFAITALIHIVFAIAVFREGATTLRESGTWLVPAWVWALAALAGGVFTAGLFWVMHHSRINPRVG